jgi:hypothetical protein
MARATCLGALHFGIALAMLPAAGGVAAAADPLSPAKLITAWRENERAFEKVRISWRASVHQPLTPAEIGPDPTGKRKTPRLNDSRAENRPASLILFGDKYRYTAIAFFMHNGVTVPVPDVAAFDSTVKYTLHEGAFDRPSSGVIAPKQLIPSGTAGSLIAPSVVCRPLLSGLVSASDPLVIDRETSEIEGRQCYAVKFPKGNDVNVDVHLSVDSETLAPVRYCTDREGAPEAVVTLKYDGPPRAESLIAWEYVLCTFGRVMEVGSATDVKIDLQYEVTDKDFIIEFPAGARVVDKRSGKEIHLESKGNGEFVPWAPKPSK